MKTLFTLLLATFLASSAFAYDGGRLSVTVARENMQVQIDGRTYYGDEDHAIVLENIPAGQHRVEVYAPQGNNRNVNNRNRYARRGNLIYSSMVYVKSQYHVDVMVNRFGKALVDEQYIDYAGNDRYGNSGNGNGSYGNGGYANGGYGNNNYRPMSDNEFIQLKDNIQRQWTDNNKVATARAALERNYFTTAQVKQVLQLLSLESNKLELAKLAYRNTVDQRSYYTLYDVFTYQSSRDELDRYIRSGGY